MIEKPARLRFSIADELLEGLIIRCVLFGRGVGPKIGHVCTNADKETAAMTTLPVFTVQLAPSSAHLAAPASVWFLTKVYWTLKIF